MRIEKCVYCHSNVVIEMANVLITGRYIFKRFIGPVV